MKNVENQTQTLSLDDQLKLLQLEELSESREKKNRQKEIARKQQEGTARAAAARRREELSKQEECPHLKPNNQTSLIAYRLSNKKTVHICQNCFKEWHDIVEVPYHLRVAASHVGGAV
jgi:FtsZ-interacting cell division protein YlmF